MLMKGQEFESERGISESSRPKWIGLFKELYPNILTPQSYELGHRSSEVLKEIVQLAVNLLTFRPSKM